MRAQRPRAGMCLARGHTARLAARSSDSTCVQWAFPDPELLGGRGSRSVARGPAASTSPRTLVKMRISRRCLAPAESESRRKRRGALPFGQRVGGFLGSGNPCEPRRSTVQFSVFATRGSQRPRDTASRPPASPKQRVLPGGSGESLTGRDTSRQCSGKSSFVNTGGRRPRSPYHGSLLGPKHPTCGPKWPWPRQCPSLL